MDIAIAHQAAGRSAEAEEVYRTILAQVPNNAFALNFLGVVLASRGEKQEGIRYMRQSIEADPIVAVFQTNLSGALIETGDFQGAEMAARAAIQRNPKDGQAHVNLAQAQWEQQREDEAIATMRRAAELLPTRADVYSHLGRYYVGSRRVEESLAPLCRAVELAPGDSVYHANLGGSLYTLLRLKEAEQEYRKAIQLKPDEPAYHTDLALVLLLAGDWTNGLREYESRLKVPLMRTAPRSYARPQWDGSPLNGRTIFLHTEQGFGDAILFSRYVPILAESGGKVILEARPELLDLFQSLKGVGQLIGRGQTPPQFDVHAPLLSVPMFLGTTPQTIPTNVPYLRPDENRIEHWRQIIGAKAGDAKMRIGLVWGGSKSSAYDQQRSIMLQDLSPLLAVKDVRWYSLQVGVDALLSGPFVGGQMVELSGDFRDFADTAAAIESLDLVISVDTSVAHVAGAIGKPVWMFVPHLPFWPWLTEGTSTGWYPTMQLFRQTNPNTWVPTVSAVAGALRQKLAALQPKAC